MPSLLAKSPPLSAAQKSKFQECLKIVREGIKTVFAVGLALKQIKDEELWSDDYDSFAHFADQECGLGKTRVYQLIEAAEVKESVSHSTIGGKIVNERQARELAQVPEEDRVKLLKKVAKEGPVTAEAIAEKRKELTEAEQAEADIKAAMEDQTKDVIVRDETGWKIPKPAQPYWARRKELLDLAAAISKVKVRVQKADEEKDLLYCGIPQRTILELESVYSALKSSAPYAVCTVCQGWGKQCSFCNSTGMVPKWRYETQGDTRVRAAREKQIEEGTA